MAHKTRPYLFYDTTTALCEECLHVVEAKILIKDSHVFLEKWCPAHGTRRALLSDDAAYYRSCRELFIKPPELPQRFTTSMQYGCPYDCGLCPDHMQHSCLTLVEITDNCNLRCPVCFASSGPHRPQHKPLADILRMLDAVVANEGEPDVVQLSGGEPTLHPQLFEIIEAARERPIRHLMINTNGIRIAQDRAYAERLAAYRQRFEIYLQFDSLRPQTLMALRGADLTRIRYQALEVLNELDLSTTLVVTLRKGLNDHEVGNIIRFALEQRCVRGVTFQPISDVGRNQDFDSPAHRLTVSEIRRAIAEQSGLFSAADVVPVPCNPDTLAMAYALRLDGQVVPLTRYVDPQRLVQNGRSTIAVEYERELRDKVFSLFATNHSPSAQAGGLRDLLCCLPQVQVPAALSYANVFRVLIVQFMDANNLDIRSLKKSCIHIAQTDGRLIPFEAFNLFYRDERRQQLEQLQARIAASTLLRR